ncbi:hypothetical protein BDZ97DRAFT_1669955 [Flammula alnicola]|nr:hypothetical protein BDZ97DRAFT_1669955 [Flammula alnicola]
MESSFNSPVVVNIRIEGASTTIFEGPVQTRGHDVTTDSAGTRRADGTNGNENPFPGPTCTAALDDMANAHGFTWDGTYNSTLDDIMITTIGGETAAPNSTFWQLALNFTRADRGGGQLQIRNGDSVLWALVSTTVDKSPLKLKGPRSAVLNTAFTVTVINGENRQPISGATVSGSTTNNNGEATITLTTVGTHTLKAQHANHARSNELRVRVTRQ